MRQSSSSSHTEDDVRMVHSSQRLLLAMTADTIVEELRAEEVERWQVTLTDFIEGGKAIQSAHAVRDLLDEENHHRDSLILVEKVAFDSLERRLQLLHYGSLSMSMQQDARPIPAEVIDDEAPGFQLATVLETMDAELDTTITVDKIERDLQADQDVDGMSFVFQRKLKVIFSTEHQRRESIQTEESTHWKRMIRSSDNFLHALGQMEVEFEGESNYIIMAHLNVQDQILYLTAPTVSAESKQRVIRMIDEDSEFEFLLVQCAEQGRFLDMRERFVAGRAEIEENRKADLVRRIWNRTRRQRLEETFTPWKVMARYRAKMFRASVNIDYLQRSWMERLLQRYCVKWNHGPQTRRVENQTREFLEEHVEEYCRVVMSEEEERARMSISMDYAWRTDQIAELYFSERDLLRWELLARQVGDLALFTDANLLRTRLVIWYRHSRRRGLQRRNQWVTQKTENRVRSRYFSNWVDYPALAKKKREKRQKIENFEVYSRATFEIIEAEERHRLSVVATEQCRRMRLRAMGRDVGSWERLEAAIDDSALTLQRELTRKALRAWTLYLPVHTLLIRCNRALLVRYFHAFRSWGQRLATVRSEEGQRVAMHRLQAKEWRALRQGHVVKLLDPIKRQAESKLRDDMMWLWLTKFRRQRNKRTVATTMDAQAAMSESKFTRLIFHRWKQYRWRVVRAVVAATLQFESEQILRRRYFELLDPIRQRLSTVSRLRQQLQAVRDARRFSNIESTPSSTTSPERERSSRVGSEAAAVAPFPEAADVATAPPPSKASRHRLFLERPQRVAKSRSKEKRSSSVKKETEEPSPSGTISKREEEGAQGAPHQGMDVSQPKGEEQ